MPGDLVLASLPDETPDDARLKSIVHNNCTGCHTPNYPLQHKFDAAGWSAIIELMKRVNVSGVYLGPDRVNGVLDFNQKELAAYLARARGPGETSMKFKLRPGRPARPRASCTRNTTFRCRRTPACRPSTSSTTAATGRRERPRASARWCIIPWADLDGNIWFTSNVPDHTTSIGRIDAQTGAVKMFKVNGQNGMAANTRG